MPVLRHKISLLFTLVSLIYVSQPSLASPANSIMQCWSPDALKAKAREKSPRYGVKGARVATPDVDYAHSGAVPSHLRGSIRRVKLPAGQKLIALTLDLCEGPGEIAGYDGKIIDYLRKHNIKATLFSGGKWMLTHPVRAQQLLADPLFEMANHGWSHGNLRNLNRKRIHSEILGAQKAYQVTRAKLLQNSCAVHAGLTANAPRTMKLFRFPYGACRPQALKAAADNGLLSIQWDVSTGDPSRGQSARRIANAVLRNTRPGSIIIAHANGRGWHTSKALPLFIPKLIEKGFKFVTVSELLSAGEPVISRHCFDARPGDTNHYGRRAKRKTKPGKRQNFYPVTD